MRCCMFYFCLMFIFACSNSDLPGDALNNSTLENEGIREYIPLDDTENPYVGLPRIVIETENFQNIRNRDVDVPARMQVWGANSPESNVMNLTIRGRGNTTWN